jgi:hypothetical protein
MKWLLLLTILSGYSGSSTATASFESKEACEAAGKSHDQAIHELPLAFFCCRVDVQPDREFLTGIAEICWRSRCQGISIK